MRIDKYIWAIRVFKSRSLASSNCKAGKVWLNEELVKASREVKVNDIVKVRKGAIHFSWKILNLPKSRVGAKLVPGYAIEVTPQEEKDKIELIKLSYQSGRGKGEGRPTKKDRRTLKDFYDSAQEYHHDTEE